MRSAQGRGDETETAALTLLQRHGLRLLHRNYRSRGGEIDLVMRDGDTLVFVEVRARRSARYGLAMETVDARKQRRLLLAARHWLMTHPADMARPTRFDVVAFQGNAPPVWLRAAFDAGG